MQRESINPKDRAHWLQLRAGDLTSTSVPALFNMSPWLTKFEAWHRIKAGRVVEDELNTSMKWGSRLEPAIAMGIAEDEGWNVRQKSEYMRLPEHRVGSSFDYETDAPALLEIKSVRSFSFRDGWAETDFGIEAPPHIEIQLQTELLVSGLTVGYIGALVDNDTVHLLKREFQPDVGDAILRAASEFWALDSAPEPDFHRDAAFIGKLYGYAAPGSVIDADEEIATLFREYAGYKAVARAAEDNAEAKRARILMRIDKAERVNFPSGGYALTKTQADVPIKAHTRKGGRPFRIYDRGEAK